MTNTPISTDAAAWDRYYAATANNQAWDLLALTQRDARKNEEMVRCAYAAAWHWARVNAPLHQARADVTIANALAATGDANDAAQATSYAQRAMHYFNENECADWDVPFVHLALARVGAVTDDVNLHTWHYNQARSLGEAIDEEDDREAFLTELDRLPTP